MSYALCLPTRKSSWSSGRRRRRSRTSTTRLLCLRKRVSCGKSAAAAAGFTGPCLQIQTFVETLHAVEGLELHPQKSRIIPLGAGLDLLGFKCFYYFRLIRKKNLRKMLQRLEKFRSLFEKENSSIDELIESFQGWNAYAMHANTYKVKRKILNKIAEILKSHNCSENFPDFS